MIFLQLTVVAEVFMLYAVAYTTYIQMYIYIYIYFLYNIFRKATW